jgi:hypothetical protein
MMKMKTLSALAFCSLFAVACGHSKGSDNSKGSAVTPSQTGDNSSASDNNGSTAINASGAQVASDKVSSLTVSDASNSAATEDEITALLAQYPDIGRDVATLKTVDKIVETDKGTYDVYAGDVLLFTLMSNNDVWAVSQSSSTFTPASITPSMSTGDAQQQSVLNSLTFTFHQCISETAPPDQQGQGQEQGKGKEAEQPKETCADVNSVMVVQREEQKQQQQQQQQQQGKDQGQEQGGKDNGGTEQPKP